MHRIIHRMLRKKNVLKYQKIVGNALQLKNVPNQKKNVILPNARKWVVTLQNAKKVVSMLNAKLNVLKLLPKLNPIALPNAKCLQTNNINQSDNRTLGKS